MSKITPRDSERPFQIDEMFFSVTDRKGLITYGNNVFLRVSGYLTSDIIGKPHNIIRHPDMPKAVFKLFWSKLLSGHPIGAYVKNLAADGSYYWVFAFAFPVDDGFLSIRFKPSSKLFTTIQDSYREILADEKLNGVDSATALLMQILAKAGFANYDAFMIAAAIEELQCRDNIVSKSHAQTNDSSAAGERAVAATLDLNTAFAKINEFKKASELFSMNTDSMQEGFLLLNTVAVNMILTASKHGAKTATLGVISKEFSRISDQIEKRLREFAEFMVKLTEVIQTCSLQLAVLKTEMLMVDFFVKELVLDKSNSISSSHAMSSNRSTFTKLFDDSANNFIQNIQSLAGSLEVVVDQVNGIRNLISSLEVVRQIGAIEAARTDETKDSFSNYLDEMDQFNLRLRASMNAIRSETLVLGDSFQTAEAIVRDLSSSVNDIFEIATRGQAA